MFTDYFEAHARLLDGNIRITFLGKREGNQKGIRNQESGIRNQESGIRNQESGIS
jgi:hypothetical protein